MMGAIVDFHSHILPGMDDGSGSIEESRTMLRMEGEQGIRHVVATPHFDPRSDSPEAFLKRRARAEARLRQEMAGREALPKVSLGAEVYYVPGMSHWEALENFTVTGTRMILVELPPAPWEESVFRELEKISGRGFIPVIAHIDRYLGPFGNRSLLKRLEALPVLIQANGSFFLKPATAGVARKMLKKQQIHLLGSDCHNLTTRPPNLGQALDKIRKRLGEEALEGVWKHQPRIP